MSLGQPILGACVRCAYVSMMKGRPSRSLRSSAQVRRTRARDCNAAFSFRMHVAFTGLHGKSFTSGCVRLTHAHKLLLIRQHRRHENSSIVRLSVVQCKTMCNLNFIRSYYKYEIQHRYIYSQWKHRGLCYRLFFDLYMKC